MRNFLFIFLLLNAFVLNAQRISLNEIQTFCSNKSWELTNKALLAQKWDYYDSAQGDDENYNIITWAFERNRYNDNKASGWLRLYSYEGLPNKVNYRFRQKEYYNAIQNQIKANNYKQTAEDIFDSKVLVTYENATYILKLSYNRVESDKDDYDYSSNPNSYTVFEVTLFKKGGVYDPNNGTKKDYDDDGNLTAEYFLKNGKIDGQAKTYYENKRIEEKMMYSNGVLNGPYEHYFYNEQNENYVVIKGNYLKGNREGIFVTKAISPSETNVINIINYRNGLKHGKTYSDITNSIKVENFKQGKLEGSYQEFLDVKKMMIGGFSNIDTLNLPKTLVADLHYENNLLNGKARFYDITGTLTQEGTYKDSLKSGEWKFYHNKFVSSEDNIEVEYSGKLYKIANYLEGKLNGKMEQFSFLNEVEIPCENESDKDCYQNEIVYIHLQSNYRDDELDGEFILKNTNDELIRKGNFSKGLKTGRWIEYGVSEYSEISFEGRNYETGSYINDKKEGQWERFVGDDELVERYFFKNDIIDGEHTIYLSSQPFLKKYFSKGDLKKVEIIKDSKTAKTIEIVSDDTKSIVLLITIVDDNDFKEMSTIKIDKYKTNITSNAKTFLLNLKEIDKKDKILNGLYKLTDAQNRTLESGYYSDNLEQGEWIKYYYDQNVKTFFNYNNGSVTTEYYFDLKKNEPFSGEFIYKDAESNTTEERKVKNGKRHGITKYRDANNKTIKKESYKDGVLKE